VISSPERADAAASASGERQALLEDIKAAVDDALAAEDTPAALWRLKQLFFSSPSLGNARFVSNRMARIRRDAELLTVRLAVARSFTVEPVLQLLEAAALLYDVRLEALVGDFNTYAQDLLDPTSGLYEFQPDVVLLAIQTRDIAPELWQDFAQQSETSVAQTVDRVLSAYRTWIGSLRSRSEAALILHNLELPAEPEMGVLDAQSSPGQMETLQHLNGKLTALAREFPGVCVLDYDGLVARSGRARFHDERKWLTARMPIATDYLWPLANEYLRFVLPLTGRVAKALVLDLDNTVWGGVLGEDGTDALQLDGEYPGAGFLALQRAVLSLHARGVILAIASKNEHNDAMAVLEHDPRMLLRPQHFAALRINWNDKAKSLREIADELNIGLDAIAFMDDSPVERNRVRQALPDVSVIDLPADPMEYAQTLRECPLFQRLSVSAEDRERGRYYTDQRQRRALHESSASLEDYLRSLETEVNVQAVQQRSIPRMAQLTQKTNQFNLTGHRYTEAQIARMIADTAICVYEVSVKDRFGDSGLVGTAITRDSGPVTELDTMLLSCRVIGRGIETAMLAHIAKQARERGARRLRGWFLPTRKNAPAQDFYCAHRFALVDRQEQGTLWELDLHDAVTNPPDWIRLPSDVGGER
jgi:FkbH-like protein